jgi:hypothetical protein
MVMGSTARSVGASKEEVEVEVEKLTQQTQPSPRAGSQEAPEAIWSSQEGDTDKQKEGEETIAVSIDEGGQSPNWEAIEDTSDKERMEEVNTKEDEGGINEDKCGGTSSPHEKSQGTEENPKGGKEPTRQSQRVKDQGMLGIKIVDKAMLTTQKRTWKVTPKNL